MKELILLRHAKSSWANPDIDDIDRPLNKRGKRGAKALGDWMRAHEGVPDQVLCSPARRTRETWEGLGLDSALAIKDCLYHADPDTMLRAIRDAEGNRVLLIGHNPGIAFLAHQLVETAPAHDRFGDYPTGALTHLSFDVASNADIEPGAGQVLHFLTPHDLVEQG